MISGRLAPPPPFCKSAKALLQIRERLNADLKHAITTSVPRRTKDGLLKKTTEHMNMLRASPERVKSYFKDKHVAYAADSQ